MTSDGQNMFLYQNAIVNQLIMAKMIAFAGQSFRIGR
jgi:hypothetical protein